MASMLVVKTKENRPFTVVRLVTWPWIGSEAGGGLVLKQTALFSSYVNATS